MDGLPPQILQSFVIVMVLGAVFAVILSFMATKKAEVTEKLKGEGGKDTELFPSVFLEINKLPLSPSQRVQTVQSLSHLFNQELQKKLEATTEELNWKHEKIVGDKDRTIQFVQDQFRLVSEKYETISQNYKKMGKERRQTEAVVRSMAEGLIVVDKEGKILLMNPAAEKLLGFKREEKVGQSIFSDLKDEELISWAENISGAEEKEIVLKSKNDETSVVLKASNAVIENENGQTMGMVSVLTNVTKQKELDELKSQFIANVSHEIRTPLYTVQESIGLLLDKIGEDPQQRKILQLAKGEMERLTRLLNDLLDFSKMENRKFRLNPTLFHLDELLQNTVETFRTWAESKRIALELKPSRDRLEVTADRDRISQVLHNLIGNALKFTPAGGKVTIETRKEHKTEPVASGWLQVRIQDTGPGISLGDRERIFEKFVQLSSPHLVGVGGTGLGLTISKEIVKLHRGKIWVESEGVKGSCFVFEIPQP